MSEYARWLGWLVIVSGGTMLAALLITFLPYMVLNLCWKYCRSQVEFIKIAQLYFADKRKKRARAGDQEIMDP